MTSGWRGLDRTLAGAALLVLVLRRNGGVRRTGRRSDYSIARVTWLLVYFPLRTNTETAGPGVTPSGMRTLI